MSESYFSQHLQAVVNSVLDSRGRHTPKVVLQLPSGNRGQGDVPAGASKGEDEAKTVSTQMAITQIEQVVLPHLRQLRLDLRKTTDLIALEEALMALAGPGCSHIAANATVPVSRALWMLSADCQKKPLHVLLREVYGQPIDHRLVNLLFNIFNGGLHALRQEQQEVLGKDRIDLQEIMVVPVGAESYQQALMWGEKIDAALEQLLLQQFSPQNIGRADEAGFSVKGLGDSKQAIALVFAAIEKAGLLPKTQVKLALDAAASSFCDKSDRVNMIYQIMGKRLNSLQMIDYWLDIAKAYPGCLYSLEDGLDENDWQHWPLLTEKLAVLGVVTVGDDLFVTQMPRLQKGIDCRAAGAILIKVNQNGSVLGTLRIMQQARLAGMRCIVSHRSGETLDDSIADLAVATGAMGLKSGDPQPPSAFPDPITWVRRQKYLRLVAIAEANSF